MIIDTNTRVRVALLLCQVLQNTVSVPWGMCAWRMGTTGVIFCHKSGAVPLISLTDVMFLKGSNSLTTKVSKVMEDKQGIFLTQNFDKIETYSYHNCEVNIENDLIGLLE